MKKNSKYLLLVTKGGETTLLTFTADELNEFNYKYSYFLMKKYIIESYVISYNSPDIILTPYYGNI